MRIRIFITSIVHIEEQQLKAFLLDSGLVSEKDIEEAESKAHSANTSLGAILLEHGKISEEDLARLKAYILGIPFVSLEHEKVDADVLQIVPEPIARKHNIVAYRKKENALEVAMLDPEDLETIGFITKKTRLKIKPRLTNRASVAHVLQQYQKSLEAEFGEIIKKDAHLLQSAISAGGSQDEQSDGLKKLAEDLPIIRIVDTLLRHAITQHASDIHIEPTENEVIVRYRIDGILHDAMSLPKQASAAVVARVKVLSALKLDEHRLPQDGRFKIENENYAVSFRVSILPVYDGEKVVMRLLLEDTKGFTLETLGFHGEGLEALHRALKKSVGMILATGPTGSGKTTTLYTLIDMLNTPGVNISTVEDPVEYRIPRVNQTQVRPEIGFTFANGLRSLVRQDPDIIMVGEIRDNETASLAINAALTGHVVLSTLHTNSAAGALPRLIDMKVEPFLIVSTVSVIISQRLVRRFCSGKEAYTLSREELDTMAKEIDLDRALAFLKSERIVKHDAAWEDISFYRPQPTDECPDGYEGRIGINEVLPLSETIKTMVMQGATSDTIEAEAKKEGMMAMIEDGIMKAVQGITSIEEVLRVTRE